MGDRLAGTALLLIGFGSAVLAPDGRDAKTPISTIQGASHLSPSVGREVTVEGVVTAVRQDGFYLQDPTGDGDPATSDALFVEAGESELRPGDRARLRGTVAERAGGGPAAGLLVTRLTNTRALRVLARGERLPRPVPIGTGGRIIPRQIICPDELPVDLRDTSQARGNRFTPSRDALDFLESLEGMVVTLRRPTALGPSETRPGGRADVFVHPDMGPAHDHARTLPGGILLRSGPDNRGDQNAGRLRVATDPFMVEVPLPALATGDRIGDVTGILDYAYGAFQVSAVARVTVESRSGWRPETTVLRRRPGHLTLATYNVLNLSPDSSDDRQRARLGLQIAGPLGAPDILALQEIQDASGEQDDGAVDGRPTLAALARAVRRAGGPAYAFVEVAPENGRPGGVPGGNIRNAFLYDSSRVSLMSHRALTPDVLAAAGAPRPDAFADSRDPLEGVFAAAGRKIVVINNHLTSRFGSTPVFGAVQPWVQAGETEREAQTRALHAYVAHLVATDPGARIVVLGDMNTFEGTDDLARFLPGSPPLLLNLITRVAEAQRYSYIFEGNSQVLDHIFVTGNLAAAGEIDVVHLNADFPGDRSASDHDPVVARFRW